MVGGTSFASFQRVAEAAVAFAKRGREG